MFGKMQSVVSSSQVQVDLVSTPTGGEVHQSTEGNASEVDQSGVLMGPLVLLLQDGSESQGLSDGDSENDGRSAQTPNDSRVTQGDGHVLVDGQDELEIADGKWTGALDRLDIGHGHHRGVIRVGRVFAQGGGGSFFLAEHDQVSERIDSSCLSVNSERRSLELGLGCGKEDQEGTDGREDDKDLQHDQTWLDALK
jgi:hypothetical protein